MLENYMKIIDEIKYQILFIKEDNLFIMGKDFMRIKSKRSDKLPYNKTITVAVFVISINSVFEQGLYYPQIVLQEYFYENSDDDNGSEY